MDLSKLVGHDDDGTGLHHQSLHSSSSLQHHHHPYIASLEVNPIHSQSAVVATHADASHRRASPSPSTSLLHPHHATQQQQHTSPLDLLDHLASVAAAAHAEPESSNPQFQFRHQSVGPSSLAAPSIKAPKGQPNAKQRKQPPKKRVVGSTAAITPAASATDSSDPRLSASISQALGQSRGEDASLAPNPVAEVIDEGAFAASLTASKWLEKLAQNGSSWPRDDAQALIDNPEVYAAYLQAVAESTQSARNYGIAAFSSVTTANLLRAATAALRSSASQQASKSEVVPEAMAPAPMELTPLDASVGNLQDQASTNVELADFNDADAHALEVMQELNDGTTDKLEKKKEAAREGWKRRRIAADERAAAVASGSTPPLTRKEQQAARRRDQRREAKRLKLGLPESASAENIASDTTMDGTARLDTAMGLSSPALSSQMDIRSIADMDDVGQLNGEVSGLIDITKANVMETSNLLVNASGATPSITEPAHSPAPSSISHLLSPALTSRGVSNRKRAASAVSDASSATGPKSKAKKARYGSKLIDGGDAYVPDERMRASTLRSEPDWQIDWDDGLTALQRSTQLKNSSNPADLERKIWATIARSSIPKVIKVQQQGLTSRQIFTKRLGGAVAREAKKYNMKPLKPTKDIQTKARRVMREMLLHMKGTEKQQRETKRKAEKEVLEKAKREEEVREAKRQARKLNFLITQTELYSHFVGSKLKTDEAEESEETAGGLLPKPNGDVSLLPSKADLDSAGSAPNLKDIDFYDDDETNLLSHARKNAESAVSKALNKAKAFDETYASEQAMSKENYDLGAIDRDDLDGDTGENDSRGKEKALKDVNIDDMNFQNPTMAGNVQILKQPTMLTCQLKEYQLKGLNWLANLYEQGINGILADEMGLGKTVQSISLMAYLAEVHNIWGPFLVVAPASTLHNWQQEIARFTPQLKVLPYWGNVKDRTTLRKFWNRKSLRYDKNAPFHVLITSYQLVVTDEQYFGKVKWQYMILDEAQAIKSSASSRWKILLGFNCRNRLLLTGTPIQNSMQELWALLHFIMPSLFDSHNEFSEWFSKDIEGSGDKNGAMNEHQLRRLHMILKPFMLRRIKKNVQNELADKIEIDVYCELTPRQRHMYRALRQNISIADLISRAASLSDDDSVKRLMNLIMQFRKVCNHPELFERADVESPFSFANYNQSHGLNKEGKELIVRYSTHSHLDTAMPRAVWQDISDDKSRDTTHVNRLKNIWSTQSIAAAQLGMDSPFNLLRVAQLDPVKVQALSDLHDPASRMRVARELIAHDAKEEIRREILDSKNTRPTIRVKRSIPEDPRWRTLGLPDLTEVQTEYMKHSRFARPDTRFYIDPAIAPPPLISISSRSYAYKQEDVIHDQSVLQAMFGVQGESLGVLTAIDKGLLPLAPLRVPQLHNLILDSGKLAKLDELLVKLKSEGHRVLVYFQMTRMIDLMEEYLAFRQYKYLRLDGSSSISDRRDMVSDWQSKPELFIFLLSTRAGGLGINLTAADTVIFYDSDWNPSNDAQAMDRAHRLGQTKQVTVYRLITRNTIDERILQLSRSKKSVQDAVVGSSTQTVGGGSSDQVKSTEVVSLLLDDDELAESLRQSEAKRQARTDFGKKGAAAKQENRKLREEAARVQKLNGNDNNTTLMPVDDEDDDAFGFFSSTKKMANGDGDDEDAEGEPDEDTTKPAPVAAAKGKGKKAAAGAKLKPTMNADGSDAPPKKKRASASKKVAPPVIGPDGLPVPQAAKKPRVRAPAKKKKGLDGMPLDGDAAPAASMNGAAGAVPPGSNGAMQ